MRPDHYLKIPFEWQPGCPVPNGTSGLIFKPAPADWMEEALSRVLATSLDPADQLAVAENGPRGAANILTALSSTCF